MLTILIEIFVLSVHQTVETSIVDINVKVGQPTSRRLAEPPHQFRNTDFPNIDACSSSITGILQPTRRYFLNPLPLPDDCVISAHRLHPQINFCAYQSGDSFLLTSTSQDSDTFCEAWACGCPISTLSMLPVSVGKNEESRTSVTLIFVY
ncbi:hypothetical protein TNCV_946491 [Trichonephila clavipes]|nr:hypothetical protein TNCV_946491 [Trichonephila clavipes]